MRVEHEHQAWALLHDANACVRMAVDPALVALGQTKDPLQLQVVLGQLGVVTACEQPRCERLHRAAHVLVDRILVIDIGCGQLVKAVAALLCRCGLRVEQTPDGCDVSRVVGHGLQLF